MLKHYWRSAQRSQQWESASKQQRDEPLLDKAMRGDPEACGILGGILVIGVFVVIYKLFK